MWGRSQSRPSWGVPESLWVGAGGWGRAWPLSAPVGPLHPDGVGGRGWAASHLLPCGPGGSWSTLASDVFDCCYLTGKLSRGGAYTFRTACVSKAGMGPYSSPSEQVLLGGPSRLGEPLGRPLWNALATSTGHTFTWGGSFCPLGPPPTMA